MKIVKLNDSQDLAERRKDANSMKKTLLDNIINQLEADLTTLRRAAAETHKESTAEENKAESKYDTRGLEASYLAEAQAGQVASLEEGLGKLKSLTLTEDDDTVTPGSIVILSGDEEYQYLLLPAGGGILLEYEGEALTVVTPESPIGSMIIGKAIADELDSEQLGMVFISEIY